MFACPYCLLVFLCQCCREFSTLTISALQRAQNLASSQLMLHVLHFMFFFDVIYGLIFPNCLFHAAIWIYQQISPKLYGIHFGFVWRCTALLMYCTFHFIPLSDILHFLLLSGLLTFCLLVTNNLEWESLAGFLFIFVWKMACLSCLPFPGPFGTEEYFHAFLDSVPSRLTE